jgi:hypothetical protein
MTHLERKIRKLERKIKVYKAEEKREAQSKRKRMKA